MRVKFWGVRGSTPVPEQNFMRYGGNTPCVEIQVDEEHRIILDCGTGIRRLGNQLAKEYGDEPLNLHIFFSHLHWDHTQGLPFFEPIFSANSSLVFYGQKYEHSKFYDKLKVLMGDIYFPVPFDQLPSNMKFVELEEEEIVVGTSKITARHLNHPGGCLGFRIENSGHATAYCTDHEHSKGEVNENVVELAQNADVLIYDAQYTPKEYLNGHMGWGHSTWKAGLEIARASGAKKLVLFHHDPTHTDEFMDEMILAPAQAANPNIIAAQEGLLLTL